MIPTPSTSVNTASMPAQLAEQAEQARTEQQRAMQENQELAKERS